MRRAAIVLATLSMLVVSLWFIALCFAAMTTRDGFLVGVIGLCVLLTVYVWLMPAWGKLMKRTFLMVLIGVVFFGCTRIDAGHVGIKVDNAGSQRGVQDLAITTGWVFYMPGASLVYEFPISVQTIVWSASLVEGKPVDESITFASKGGTQFSADISASFAIDPANAPKFFVKFRNDDVYGFMHGYFRNITRDSINETSALMTPDEIMSDRLTELIAKSRERLTQEADKVGVRLVQFGFVGAPRPPQGIAQAINAKNQAVQDAVRVENELRVQKAQAAKVVAEAEGNARAVLVNAEAQAKANALLSSSITPTLVQWEAVKKWNGARPTVEGSGGGVLLNLPMK